MSGYLSSQCVVCLKFCNGLKFLKCVLIFSDYIDLADKILQSWDAHPALASDGSLELRAKFNLKILLDEYRKMFDQSLSKSKDLGDMLKFLPGVVVQKSMRMQGMADLYRIKPDLLGYFIKSIIDSRYDSFKSHYTGIILDDYLSGYLQDRDRSQHYYCDPMLQHISICRHFLSLLDGLISETYVLDFQS